MEVALFVPCYVDQVFPAAVGRSQSQPLELIGSSPVPRLDLPATDQAGVLPLSWPGNATWSGPRPFVRLNTGPPSEALTRSTLKGRRPVYFPEWQEHRPTPVYDRYLLAPGAELEAPAIVEERESTMVIGPGARIQIDESRNLSVWL